MVAAVHLHQLPEPRPPLPQLPMRPATPLPLPQPPAGNHRRKVSWPTSATPHAADSSLANVGPNPCKRSRYTSPQRPSACCAQAPRCPGGLEAHSFVAEHLGMGQVHQAPHRDCSGRDPGRRGRLSRAEQSSVAKPLLARREVVVLEDGATIIALGGSLAGAIHRGQRLPRLMRFVAFHGVRPPRTATRHRAIGCYHSAGRGTGDTSESANGFRLEIAK
jgi:hypothetical protein